jgi:hypothetical protein
MVFWKKPCDLHNKSFLNPSFFLRFLPNSMYFTGNDDGPSIEEYIQNQNSSWKEQWKICLHDGFKEYACIWWNSFNYNELMTLSNETYETLILDRWYHVGKRDTKRTKGFFSYGNSIL